MIDVGYVDRAVYNVQDPLSCPGARATCGDAAYKDRQE